MKNGLMLRSITMKRYMCVICGFVYDEEKGWPDDGIAPGTRWEDVPLNWCCPQCGARKEDFEMIEI
jgi:rubredoxin